MILLEQHRKTWTPRLRAWKKNTSQFLHMIFWTKKKVETDVSAGETWHSLRANLGHDEHRVCRGQKEKAQGQVGRGDRIGLATQGAQAFALQTRRFSRGNEKSGQTVKVCGFWYFSWFCFFGILVYSCLEFRILAFETHDIFPHFFHIFRDSGPHGIWLIKGVGLLNINLMSSVLSFVDLSTKLAAMRVCRGFHEVLQCGDAWDPLVMNRFQCQGMLRFVRASWFSASRLREDCKWKFCRLPPAFHQVSVLDIDLMDAERSVRDQSDTEDEERRPIPLTIVSPLREFSRGWRSFTRIASLTLRNIDYYSMGYDFLHFRCICLKSFGFVKLHYTGNRTYRLEASAEREPPVVNCKEVALMNSNRLPASTRVQATTLSEREALFLLEHPTSYKNGNDIRFIHDVNLINSHSVRKQYKPLVESLKERFPTFRPT